MCLPIIVFLGSDYAVILVDSPSDDGNILTKEAMDAIWELHSVALEIEVIPLLFKSLSVQQKAIWQL